MTSLAHPKYRADIDGLRAIAILSVVGFHAFPFWVKGGFIGVDIFFVISGFLISTIILVSLERNSFGFVEFYSRRIKRIFPALLLVLIASFTLGWFVLLADEYKQLGKHIAGGAGFISNFLLWNESGYFDNAAETKPLLHLWSLGIEEQFYIIWPPLLWFAWKKRLDPLIITLVVAAISFALNIAYVRNDAVAAFYSPQTRFWELMAGSVLAHAALHKQNTHPKPKLRLDTWLCKIACAHAPAAYGNTLRSVQSALGAALIAIGIFVITKQDSFPGWWAVLPTLGAVLIISAGAQAWLNRVVLSNRLLVWFGLISFPLYLWHWSLLSFARILASETPSREMRIAAVLISILFSWLTYRMVEKPMRFGAHGKAKTVTLLVLMALAGLAGYNCYLRDGLGFRKFPTSQQSITEGLKWDNLWVNAACEKKFQLTPVTPCMLSDGQLNIMIMGDSHANHLYPGLESSSNLGVISVGSSSNLLDIFRYQLKGQDPYAAVDFVAINFKVLEMNPNIDTVILSTFLRSLLDGKVTNKHEREIYGGFYFRSRLKEENSLTNQEIVYRGLARTIKKLYVYKKRVILVRSTPDIEQDFRDYCLKRINSNTAFNCSISRKYVESQRANEDKLIESLSQNFPDLLIYDPINILCDSRDCFLIREGKALYRDHHHLSVYGSELVGKEIVKQFFLQ